MDVTLAVIGAGQRGCTYAKIASDMGARVVGVAEPRKEAREHFADEYGISDDAVFSDWRDLLTRPRMADAVVICTQDRDHVGPAVEAARRGYDILLEKPMAIDEEGARQIVSAVHRAGVISAVCHVLRYTEYTRQVKALLAEGVIGRVASMQHLEPVGWWHFAHSFVRGNWRSEEESSPLLMAKSVHDIDWVGYVMGGTASRVSSFGTLMEFRPENKPDGAAERCLDCVVRDHCPYDAVRIYRGFLNDPDHMSWPLGVLTPDPTVDSVDKALREGPYGECVYNGRNDVVDHQVVSMEFPSGANVSFCVEAFTEMAGRKTRIFGTRGWLEGDGSTITVHDFTTDSYRTYDTEAAESDAAGGHGGGDGGLVRAFLNAVDSGDQSLVDSDVGASYESLKVVWAAEKARKEGTVVTL